MKRVREEDIPALVFGVEVGALPPTKTNPIGGSNVGEPMKDQSL